MQLTIKTSNPTHTFKFFVIKWKNNKQYHTENDRKAIRPSITILIMRIETL